MALAAFRSYLESLASLSHHEWQIIAAAVEVTPIRKSDFFLREGQICYKAAFIVSGVMRYCTFQDGNEVTCYFISENQFAIDIESYQALTPSQLNIQAVTDCMMLTLTRQANDKLLQQLPRWQDIISRIIAIELMDKANQRSFLMNQDARSRYKEFIQRYPHLLLRVPLGQIASYLGITQQSLSRLRRDISI